MKSSQKSSTFDPRECTIAEAQGYVINQLFNLERYVDLVLTKFVQPNDPHNFQQIFLNSLILSFSNKLKLLQFYSKMPDSAFQDFHKVLNIRNSFAHAFIFQFTDINVTQTEASPGKIEEHVTVGAFRHEVKVVENGKLLSQNADELLDEFIKKMDACRHFILDEYGQSDRPAV